MENFSSILQQATEAIDQKFYLLPVVDSASLYRERVYCYELYHQMRTRWSQTTDYCLNGEVDKRSHPYFQESAARAPKPDLLVHKPGSSEYNYAVIEVKTEQGLDGGIEKDIKTLSLFKSHFGYERAIYLIYGPTAPGRMNFIEAAAQRIHNRASIEIWTHSAPGAAAILQASI